MAQPIRVTVELEVDPSIEDPEAYVQTRVLRDTTDAYPAVLTVVDVYRTEEP